jgi:hypothetical protein
MFLAPLVTRRLLASLGVSMTSVRDFEAERWRELGFWYDFTPSEGWTVRGSALGLERLASLLEQFAADPKNAQISEHAHFGPHMYLKVVTWASAEVNHDGIYGSPSDLRRLAAVVRQRLVQCGMGRSFEVSRTYSESSSVRLTIHLEDDTFDPATFDRSLST